ncbi:MAG TPA: DegT/DnrJ/EryC1/StrS family aminotransferase [Actinocrinis sp.]|nr:DegT/DnrJ/EryC1/StrS family aminotransferase [Actinocrinis sp.]
MIPITVVDVRDAEPYVLEVLRSGSLAQGPMVERFERRFAEICEVEHAVAVNSGTSALIAALQVLDLEPGDEVVTTPFTFVATLNAILAAGATARLVDVRAEDCCVDPAAMAAAVTPRTKVLMPVHLYGQTADMGAITKLAADKGLSVVEDAAQAHGARYEDKPAGGFGLGCFSFYATKNITTGEGGAITTNDAGLADRLRVLRNQGMRERYVYEVAGHNYRMTDLHAAIAIPQLDRIESIIAARQSNARFLSAGLADVPGLTVPSQLEGRTHVWHQYTIQVDAQAPVTRDELAAGLTRRGIGCGVYYPKLVGDYDCYRGHPRVASEPTPVAARIARECLSLPVHAKLTEAELGTVVDAVRAVFATGR